LFPKADDVGEPITVHVGERARICVVAGPAANIGTKAELRNAQVQAAEVTVSGRKRDMDIEDPTHQAMLNAALLIYNDLLKEGLH
jgi:hypothetical protein